jgi:hypothetical protein
VIKTRPCKRCPAHVHFARKAEDTSKWTVLDAEPVEPSRVHDASTIRVLDGQYAYRLAHMRESIEMRAPWQPDNGPAEDRPWYPIHHCKEN